MADIRPFGGKQPMIDADAWVDSSAVVIGDVQIAAGASIWPTAVVRGDIQSIRIGARSNIQDGSVLHVTHDSRFNPGGHPLTVGNEVTVGHRVTLHGCEIGDQCLIGMAAVVLDAVVIESQVILAAGSLVPAGKVLQGGYLWRGAPARRVRRLTEEELEYFPYVAANYVKLAARYRDTEGSN